MDGQPEDEDFNLIQPTLIQQLKNILQQYPDNGQILKEIIQNAEDAGAKLVRFLYDENDEQTMFAQGIDKLQGPSLYSYNDAYFRKEDWEGIRMFGQSLKENDPLKVGRFGLGFKSTFHLTDDPTIMSDRRLGIINPDENLFSSTGQRSTGKVIDLSKPSELQKSLAFHRDSSDVYKDILATDINTGTCKGSLFRFNFRQKASELSSTIYSEEKIIALFDSFKSEGHLALLFMKNLEKIEFFIRKRGKPAELVYSFSTDAQEQKETARAKTEFVKAIEEAQAKSKQLEKWLIFQTRISAKEFCGATVSSERVMDYSVIHYFAGETLAKEKSLTNSEIAKDLGLLPLVGIAYPSSCKDLETGGHVFCTLPLPILGNALTSLPVHVNGFFALGPDRKDLKWPSASQEKCSDKQILWNQFLIQRALPVAYEKLFCQMKSFHRPTVVYGSFPDMSIVDGKWQSLGNAFFERIFPLPCIWTEASNGQWICPKDAWFEVESLKQTGADSALKCVVNSNLPAVRLPRHVEYAFSTMYQHSVRRFIDKAKVRAVLKMHPYVTQQLAYEDRLNLLSYVVCSSRDITELFGVPVLPLESGLFFAPNITGRTEKIYIPSSKHPKELLPGLEGKMLKSDIDKRIISILCEAARTGLCQLAMLNENTVPGLLKDVIPYAGQPSPRSKLKSVFHYTNIDTWLQHVWRYAKKFNLVSKLTGLPLIPLESANGECSTIRCAAVSANSTLLYLGKSNCESLAAFMSYLGFDVLRQLPPYILDYAELLNKFMHQVTPNSMIALFLNMRYLKSADQLSSEFRAYRNNEVKIEIRQLLCKSTLSLREACTLFKKFPLFQNTLTEELCSVEDVNCICPQDMPTISLRRILLNCSDDDTRRFAKQLGAVLWTKQQLICSVIVPEIAERKHNERNVDELMKYVLRYSVPELKAISFIPAADSRRYKPNQLFDPQNQDLQLLFSHDKGKFPTAMYKEEPYLQAIKQLGLKSVREVSAEDVQQIVTSISTSAFSNEAVNKIKLLLYHVEKYPHVLSEKAFEVMRRTCWIPVMKERPDDYPKTLTWHADRDSNQYFEKPIDMTSDKHSRLLGAVKKVCSTQYVMTQMKIRHFLGAEPTLVDVLTQLRHVAADYEDQYKPENIIVLRDIYDWLSKCGVSRVAEALEKLNFHDWIWNGEGFSAPNKIVTKPDSQNLDLSPYVRQMPTEMQRFQQMLLNFGANVSFTSEMLIEILEEMKRKYDQASISITNNSALKDLKISSDIITRLSQESMPKDLRERLLVPINTNSHLLKLELAEDTVYCHYSSDDYHNDVDEDMIYLHKSIAEDTATSLGIRSVTSKMLDAEDLGLFEEYGQTEPLTRRINRILQDYGDGSAIIKELIQNADDAGATELKLLYDERQNKNQRNSLIDPGMREFQGPALWAYNNATFSKEDFENITKLSGATKENQRDKVGKFGLGFNAVYNITDVPSLISKDQLVIFDPHTTNLGRAISDKSKPGVKINIGLNRSRLKPFKDQLMPYHDVFGVDMNIKSSCEPYNGTLFRFPLRTRQQAIQSEIKDLHYDDNEMKQLLHKFALEAKQMLIFTQHVREIAIFHLTENSSSPNDMKELLTVKKENAKEVIPLVVNGVTLNHSEVMKLSALAVDQAHGDISRYHPIRCSNIISMTFKISENGQRYFNNDNLRYIQSKWLIHAASGSNSSSCLEMAFKHSKRNPVSSVAISVDEENTPSILSYRPLTKRNKVGHFFCFLPLPIENGLPVHINGTFAVTHDRKSMQGVNEDDKYTSTTDTRWNQALMAGPVATAYLGALEDLTKLTNEYKEESWYELWPAAEKQAAIQSSYNKSLFKGFYDTLVRTRLNLFPSAQKQLWVSWGDIIIIDRKLSQDVKESIETVLQCYEKDRVVMHMPNEIIQSILDAGLKKELDSVTITFENFFAKIFQPNITDENMPGSARENIVLFLLRRLNEYSHIKQSLVSLECIPTLPNGKLKCPSQLVRPNSKASPLYEINEEVFPKGAVLNEPAYLAILETLGMVSDKITWELLEARACTISTMQDNVAANKRSRMLICLIEEQLKKAGFSAQQVITLKRANYPRNQNWKTIKFLPVKNSPDTWRELPWGGNCCKEKFHSIEGIYPSSLENLVGCHSPIIDEGEKGCGRLSRIILEFFDIPTKPTISQICRQMDEILGVNLEVVTKLVKSVYKNIYEFLNEDLERPSRKKSKSRGIEELRQWIQNKPLILINDRLVRKEVVAFEHHYQSDPYLYELPKYLRSHYQSLMSAIGVKQRFDLNDYVLALQCLEKDYHNMELQDSQIKLVRNILESIERFETEIDIFLPDNKGILCPKQDICVKDARWIPDEPNLRYIHHQIPVELALALGAKTVRSHSISTHSQGMPFGQHEKLTVRLKKILDGYPAEMQILLEILQNADDAGATKLQVILDNRSHPNTRVFSDAWKAVQGPAILFCNNAPFTESDLQGIQDLGEGSKSDDPLKTGQFGVGFNVVYHVTDVPSLLTYVEGKGSVLCVFDPHVRFLDGCTLSEPGRMFSDARNFLASKFPDVYETFIPNVLTNSRSTIFRLPLRGADMAQESKIKSTPIACFQVREMLNKFKNEVAENMMFLRNVESIELSEINIAGKRNIIYSISSQYSESDRKSKTEFNTEFESNVRCLKKESKESVPSTFQSHGYRVTIQDSLNNHCSWHIIQKSASINSQVLPDSVEKQYDKGLLRILPKGGIACRLDKNACKEGKVFCLLPLQVSSSLPLHINGNFILDYETRRQLWFSKMPCFQNDWNRYVIEKCIVPCYITLLERFAKELKINQLGESGVKIIRMTFPKPICRQYHYGFSSSTDNNNLTERHPEELQFYFRHFPVIKDNGNGVFAYDRELIQMFYKNVEKCQAHLLPVIRTVDTEADRLFIDFCPSNCQEKQFYVPDHLLSAESKTYSSTEIADICLLLLKIGIHIYNLPQSIVCSFEESEAPLKKLTPDDVRNHLRHNAKSILAFSRPVAETIFKEVKIVQAVLKYCLDSEGIKMTDLEGLPLLVTEDNHLRTFDSNTEVYFNDLSKLFPNKKFMCLHYELRTHLSPFKHATCGWLRVLTLESLDKFLREELDPKLSSDSEQEFNDNNEMNSKFPREDWLCHLWSFLRLEHGRRKEKQRQEEEKRRVEASRKSRNLLQNYCPMPEESFVDFLQTINNWCLLPIERKSGDLKKPYRKYLMRIGLIHSIVRLGHRMGDIGDEIGLPRLNKNVVDLVNMNIVGENAEYIKQAFGSDDDPESILKALFIETERKNSGIHKLSSESAQRVLEYFNDFFAYKQIDLSKLKYLPLFEDITGKRHALNKGGNTYIVPIELPSAGIRSLEGVIFLRENDRLHNLFKRLGYEKKEWAFAYQNYIFPFFSKLKSEERLQHLEFLRKSLMDSIYFLSSEDHHQRLLNCLEDVAFIEKSGELCCASQFFDPEVKVFKLMLGDEKFPSDPFSEDKWLLFLRKFGLKKLVSAEMFAKFAQEISHEALEKEETRSKSEALVEYLSEAKDLVEDKSFLQLVSKINFIIPDPVPNELDTIWSSGRKQNFICFADAICNSLDNLMLAWTVENVLPTYTRTSSSYRSELPLKYLSVKEIVPYLSVAQNLVNIASQSKLLKRFAYGVQELTTSDKYYFEKVLLEAYEFLSESHSLDDANTLPILKHHPVIFVNDGKMVIPEKSTLDERRQIPPYLFAVPTKYGKHYDFFQELGTTKQPTCTQYANVLREIHASTQNNALEPNEFQAALKAVSGIYDCIQDDKKSISTIENLYLPGTTAHDDQTIQLFNSEDLVYFDDNHFEGRLCDWKRPRISFNESELAPDRLLKIVSNLPDKFKPIYLSDVIKEKLLENCVLPNLEFANKLESQFKCNEFLGCMTRLLKHQKRNNPEHKEELIKALEVIKNIFVSTLKEVNTALYDSAEQIVGSELPKDLFVIQEETGLHFYISAKLTGLFDARNLSSVARELSIFFRNFLTDSSLTPLISGLLSCSPDEMHPFLDDENILRDTDLGNQPTAMYQIGEFVPVELHCLLVNEFVTFEMGEFVAYEAEDPADENADGEPVYIYAKFKGKCEEECESCLRHHYKIEFAPGEFKHVHFSQLYRFVRQEDLTGVLVLGSETTANEGQQFTEEKDLDEVMKEITKQIEEAFKENEEYAMKIIKRLYLRWHPDKNIGRESFCTKVFQHIQQEAQRLKNRNDSGDPDNWNWSSYFSRFNNRGNRYGSKRRSFTKNYRWHGSGGSQGYWRPNSGTKNPQPGEARRWHRQSQCDFEAAKVGLNGNYFEWVCFMCHQAAEKGLKAVVYTSDAKKTNDHNLCRIALDIDDNHIKELASRLESLLGSSTKLSYPDQWIYPKIPHTEYDGAKASEALVITESLMKAIELIMV